MSSFLKNILKELSFNHSMTIFPAPPDMKSVGTTLVVVRILNTGNRKGYPYNLWSFSCYRPLTLYSTKYENRLAFRSQTLSFRAQHG